MAERLSASTRLHDLTVVIPTFERPAYLRRALHFWAATGAQVIVVDGSAAPLCVDGTRSLPPNVSYLHRPVALQMRLREASTHLTTSFAMLCSDDEFMMPTGIVACMHFLQQHPSYSVCCGRVIGFRPGVNDLQVFPLKLGQRSYAVEQETPADRVAYHLHHYQVSTVYGVHRRECLQFCLSHAMSSTWSNAYAGELGMELLAAAHGKSVVLPVPSWLRSQENAPVSVETFNRARPVEEWLTADQDASEVERFVRTLAAAVHSRMSTDDMAVVARVVQEVLYGFAHRHRPGAAAAPPTAWQTAAGLLVRLRERHRTHPIFRVARTVYRAMTGRATDNDADFFASRDHYKFSQLSREHGIEISAEAEQELLEILQQVLEFHRGTEPRCA